jgi:PIN domain nuclease of toxin-antitoxin system
VSDFGYVLDASAVLAMLGREPGGEAVASVLLVASVSTVNWSEVLQKGRAHGVDMDGLQEDFEGLGVTFVPFGISEAGVAADLWHRGARRLSFADRACLATAVVREVPALTADREWTRLDLDVDIEVVRGQGPG